MSDWSAGQPPRRRPQPRQQGRYDYYRDQGRQQPPPRPQAEPGEPARRPGKPARRRPRRRWGRRVAIAFGVVLALLVALVVYVDSVLQRTPALADYPGRISDTPGTNWLLVGSDSRQDLNEDRREALSVGQAGGRRADTVMLLHIPESGGRPSLISLPRDSAVPIPGHGRNKLNAAFAIGGPRLLVRTVETVTGVHLDHYAEIGLGGLAKLVNAVGGVRMCLDQPMNDPKAGIHLPAGCQELDGAQALGFVRSRAFATGDLQRVQNQRQLLGELVDKIASPATLLNPFRLFPLISAAGETFAVDDDDHVWHLVWLALALGEIGSGQGVTTTVPIAGFGTLNGQSVVQWDSQQARRLFNAIANDEPIPPELLPE